MTVSVKDRMALHILKAAENSTVATLLPDPNKKYLSTDLCRKETVENHYLAPRLELGGQVIPSCDILVDSY